MIPNDYSTSPIILLSPHLLLAATLIRPHPKVWFSDLDFRHQWAADGESSDPLIVETALRRWHQTRTPSAKTNPESEDLSLHELDLGLNALLSDPAISDAYVDHTLFHLPANRIPWTPTGIHLRAGETISTFSSGRLWRSKALDLWIGPQFGLWYKIGVDGRVFNSTGESNTFIAETAGELYVANQLPGRFTNPLGGRVSDNLGAYQKTKGSFNSLIVRWRDGTDVAELLEGYGAPYKGGGKVLAEMEVERVERERARRVPEGWWYLWFSGRSAMYSLTTATSPTQQSQPSPQAAARPCINCKPHQTIGVLQRSLSPTLPFHPNFIVSWSWLISSLPSRLREDLGITHDYLSLAFEFENGRDLSYTWSCELPVDYGYWCPFPTWQDREYHVVIRSGTDSLGKWVEEKRDLYADYVKYIEEGRTDEEELKARMPRQVVKVWLIGSNLLQKYEAEMTISDIKIEADGGIVQVL